MKIENENGYVIKLFSQYGIFDIPVTAKLGLLLIETYKLYKEGKAKSLFVSNDLILDFSSYTGIGILEDNPPQKTEKDLMVLRDIRSKIESIAENYDRNNKEDDDDEPWRESLRPDR